MKKSRIGLYSRFMNGLGRFHWPLLLSVALVPVLGASLIVPNSGEASYPEADTTKRLSQNSSLKRMAGGHNLPLPQGRGLG